jgi:hypothetical protein
LRDTRVVETTRVLVPGPTATDTKTASPPTAVTETFPPSTVTTEPEPMVVTVTETAPPAQSSRKGNPVQKS